MKVGRFRGINFIVNDFFILLLLAYGMLGVLAQAVLIFLIVLLHELAHVLAARHYGLQVREVELYPFGGVARLDGMLEISPAVEARVALAGPMSNFFMLAVALALQQNFNLDGLAYKLFAKANFTMAIFNLLPVLPLDGGRILRAVWSRKIGLTEATWRTALWGRYLAVLLALAGCVGLFFHFNDLNMIITAVFIYLAALKHEEATVYLFLRYLLRKHQELEKLGVLPLKQLVVTCSTTIKKVLPKFSPGNYHMLIIVDQEGKILGNISEYQLIDALFKHGSSLPLGKML